MSINFEHFDYSQIDPSYPYLQIDGMWYAFSNLPALNSDNLKNSDRGQCIKRTVIDENGFIKAVCCEKKRADDAKH